MSLRKTTQLLSIIALLLFVSSFFFVQDVQAQAVGFGDAVAKTVGNNSGFFDVAAGAALKIPLAVIGFILLLLKLFFSFLLGVSGMLLNTAIQFSLDTTEFKSGSLGPSIDAGWIIIRDLINMSFIFIVMYIAITNIIGLPSAGDKKALGKLVVAALLINFSKLIASVVFDIGNIVALSFYKIINAGEGLSDALVTNMKILSVYDFPLFEFSLSNQLPYFIQEIIVSIIFLITALAFLFAAMLFIGRSIMIMFLLMSSPIGFAGMILPKFKKYSEKWWHELINQSAVAPIFLFFMVILVKITNEYAFVLSNPDLQKDFIGIFFNFAIVIGVIIFAIKTTKSLSGQVGAVAVTAAGIVGGAALGATALAGRATIGRAGSAVMSRYGESLAKASEEGGAVDKRAARLAQWSSIKARESTFDARQTSAGKKALKGLSSQTGIDVSGSQARGGFKGSVDRKVKEKEAYDKKLGNKALNQEVVTGGEAKTSDEAYDHYEKLSLNDPKASVVHNGKRTTAEEARKDIERTRTQARYVKAMEQHVQNDPNKIVFFDGRQMKASEALSMAQEAQQKFSQPVKINQEIKTVKEARASRAGGIMGALATGVFGEKSLASKASRNVQVKEEMEKKAKDSREINIKLKEKKRERGRKQRELARVEAQRNALPSGDSEYAPLDKQVKDLENILDEIENDIDDLEDKKLRINSEGGKSKDDKKDDKKDSS